MNDNLKSFMEFASKNQELRSKLQELNKNVPDPAENRKAVIALAAEYGIVLTEEDIVHEKKGAQPIDDDELAAVTGGLHKCACWGGGIGSHAEYTCVCVSYGTGDYCNDDQCCECFLFGLGDYYN